MPGTLRRSSGDRNIRNGSVSGDKSSDPDIRSFTLRAHRDVIDQVDEAVSNHPVIRNRNTWIVNAIVEQLKRESHNQKVLGIET
jgi:hypothetical protein